jgi:acetyltransferase-like isoleucine patch superfamily enzyme
MRIHNAGRTVIGRGVRINSGPSNYVGGDRRMAIWVGKAGRLEIGDGCALSNSTIVCTDRVVIGEHAFIGGSCDIYDTDFHQLDAESRIRNEGPIGHGPVLIGPKAFIGGGTMILKNVTIGEGAVVGARSLVTRSIPAYEIWAGCPARFIRKVGGEGCPMTPADGHLE